MNENKKEIMAATALGTVALLLALWEAWEPALGIWYLAAMVLAAGGFLGVAVWLQREGSRFAYEPVGAEAGTERTRSEMGRDLKAMYETISIALDNAGSAQAALLQFCAANGYRALTRGKDYFVQDLRTGKVYAAEFPLASH